jgi:transcriptional regulator with XRE-family HTH domain
MPRRKPTIQLRFQAPAAPIPEELTGDDREREEARRIGEALRLARTRRGLMQNELASAAGMPAAQISAIECGRRPPSLKTLRRVCAALGAKPEDLLRAASVGPSPAASVPGGGEGGDAPVLPGLADLFQSPEERLFAPLARAGIVRTVRADPLSSPPPTEECVRIVERRIADYLRLETICGAFAGASIPLALPFTQDAAGAEELAARVRRLLGLGDSIVLDYVSVLESHGIRVLFVPNT